jgi:hypothetical protein
MKVWESLGKFFFLKEVNSLTLTNFRGGGEGIFFSANFYITKLNRKYFGNFSTNSKCYSERFENSRNINK